MRILLLIYLTFVSVYVAQAQAFGPANNLEGAALKDRIFFGGNFGLQFGTQTVVDINPIVGYRINNRLSAGVGVKYLYYKYKDRYFSYETNIYGGSVFGRYAVTESLFAYSEYEMINLAVFDPYERRVDVGSMFVGGGYSQPIGGRSSLYLMLLYNLNESTYSPYQNPIIRMGIGIGI
jgi:hypothetical protein